jgi:hypothetical protein
MTITPNYTNTGQLQYSTDLTTWIDISSGATTSSTKVIYMRGIMNTASLFTSNTSTNKWNFNNASNLRIKGNLNTLLNYQNPPTTLAENCYASMFNNCTSLTSIPSGLLPATTLANSCYQSMFSYTAITSIPENLLPATTLAEFCYSAMFSGCTSLTSIPSNLLPASTLTRYCYQGMFNGCSLLEIYTTSGEGHSREFRINASTVATGSLLNMFRNTIGSFATSDDPTINTTYYIKDLN